MNEEFETGPAMKSNRRLAAIMAGLLLYLIKVPRRILAKLPFQIYGHRMKTDNAKGDSHSESARQHTRGNRQHKDS